jgi:hypothetical protein
MGDVSHVLAMGPLLGLLKLDSLARLMQTSKSIHALLGSHQRAQCMFYGPGKLTSTSRPTAWATVLQPPPGVSPAPPLTPSPSGPHALYCTRLQHGTYPSVCVPCVVCAVRWCPYGSLHWCFPGVSRGSGEDPSAPHGPRPFMSADVIAATADDLQALRSHAGDSGAQQRLRDASDALSRVVNLGLLRGLQVRRAPIPPLPPPTDAPCVCTHRVGRPPVDLQPFCWGTCGMQNGPPRRGVHGPSLRPPSWQALQRVIACGPVLMCALCVYVYVYVYVCPCVRVSVCTCACV